MNNKQIVALIIVGLIVFGLVYGFVLYKFDLVVRDLDDYYYNPDCERIKYSDGSFQLENCARYKLKNGNK